MLVVVSPERQRITSNELVKKYSKVHFMVKSSDGYCTTSCPESRAVQTGPFLEAKLRPFLFRQGHRHLSVGAPSAEPIATNLEIQIVTHRSASGIADHEDKGSNQTFLRPAGALHSQSGANSIQPLTADSVSAPIIYKQSLLTPNSVYHMLYPFRCRGNAKEIAFRYNCNMRRFIRNEF